MRTVLIPTDFSAHVMHTIEYAITPIDTNAYRWGPWRYYEK